MAGTTTRRVHARAPRRRAGGVGELEALLTPAERAFDEEAAGARRTPAAEPNETGGRVSRLSTVLAGLRGPSTRRTTDQRTSVGPVTRGWRGRGGGWVPWIDPAPEWIGSSVQVCGLWPFSAGRGTPPVGVPVGRVLSRRGGPMCADPINWFLANLISSPSAFVLGRPGLGKSTLIRKMLSILPNWGIIPMILSDTKPDYVRLCGALDGQVITLGRGKGNINPLDAGPMAEFLAELPTSSLDEEGREVNPRAEALAEVAGRRANVVQGLLELVRGSSLESHERNVLTTALRLIEDDRQARRDAGEPDPGQPLIGDVLDLIRRRPPALSAIVQDRDDPGRYQDRTERLVDGLLALTEHGPFGDMFAKPTAVPIRLDRPVVFDISSIDDTDTLLQAGVQLVCWSYGSSAVSCAKALADAGLRPKRIYLLIMDELWRILQASELMVAIIDALQRLNRQRGLGQILCTHTMNDLAMPTEAATMKAWGFVERSSMVFLGGLAEREMGNLRQVFAMGDAEAAMIASWSDEATISHGNRAAAPPGRGKFLLKIGKGRGIPFQTILTAGEAHVNDTNVAWHELAASRIGGAVA